MGLLALPVLEGLVGDASHLSHDGLLSQPLVGGALPQRALGFQPSVCSQKRYEGAEDVWIGVCSQKTTEEGKRREEVTHRHNAHRKTEAGIMPQPPELFVGWVRGRAVFLLDHGTQ